MEKQKQLIEKASCCLHLLKVAKLKLQTAENYYKINSGKNYSSAFLFCPKEKAFAKIEFCKAVCKRIADYYNNLTREIHLYQLIENKNY